MVCYRDSFTFFIFTLKGKVKAVFWDFITVGLNKLDEATTPLTSIQAVPGSNLCQDKCEESTSIRLWFLPSASFPFYYVI
jgi:hypothetical protein